MHPTLFKTLYQKQIHSLLLSSSSQKLPLKRKHFDGRKTWAQINTHLLFFFSFSCLAGEIDVFVIIIIIIIISAYSVLFYQYHITSHHIVFTGENWLSFAFIANCRQLCYILYFFSYISTATLLSLSLQKIFVKKIKSFRNKRIQFQDEFHDK